MKNIVVLVSGGGTNLGAIIRAINDGIIKNGKVSLVVSSNEDAYALTRAKDNGIPSVVVRRKDYTNAEEYSRALKETVEKGTPDLIVLAGFMCILTKTFTESFPDKIINVHPSLIPSFCGEGYYGLRVHEEALKYGVKVTGATVHFVNEEVDGGAIIAQKAVYINEDDTPETLQKRVMEQAEQIILPQVVNTLINKE